MPPKLALAADPRLDLDQSPAYASDAEARDWLEHVDDAFLACRGNHNFPKMRLTGGKLPDGITARRQTDRSYQITEICPDCGVKRTYSTVPDGWLGTKHHYVYDWPDGYRMPYGASAFISIADCRGELWRRIREQLDAEDDRRAARRRRARAKAANGD
jgi:hypothetical protein